MEHKKVIFTIGAITLIGLVSIFSFTDPTDVVLWVYFLVFIFLGCLSFAISYGLLGVFTKLQFRRLLAASTAASLIILFGFILLWSKALNIAASMLLLLLLLVIAWYIQQRSKTS